VVNQDFVNYTDVEIVVVALYEGIVNKDGETFTQSQGVLSQADVLTAQRSTPVYESQIGELHGGKRRLRPIIRSALRSLVKFVKSDTGKKLTKKLGKTAMDMAMSKMSGKGMTGAGLTGGKMLSRSQLMDM